MAFPFYLYGSVSAGEIRLEGAKGHQSNPKQRPAKEKISLKILFMSKGISYIVSF